MHELGIFSFFEDIFYEKRAISTKEWTPSPCRIWDPGNICPSTPTPLGANSR